MGSSILLCRIFVLFCLINIACCEVYTSINDLRFSVNVFKANSQQLKDTIKDFVHKQMERMDRVEELIQTIKEVTGEEMKDPEFKITHPMNAFRFLRNQSEIARPALDNIVQEIEAFENDTETTLNSSFTREILNQLPDNEDFSGSVNALARLHHVYGIVPKEVADGAYSSDPSIKLTAAECTDISVLCHLQGMHYYGRQWMLEARDRAIQEKLGDDELLAISRKAAAAAMKDGNVMAANFLYSKRNGNRKRNRKTALLDKRVKTKLEEVKTSSSDMNRMRKSSTSKWIPNYQEAKTYELCSYWRTGKWQDTGLTCRYEDNGHPILQLQPMKYEEINRKPYIAVIHNAFNERWTKGFIRNGAKRLSRSKTGRKSDRITSSYRLSKTAYGNYPSPKLADKIEAMTSFRPNGEMLQVANYGIGGHYALHRDPLPAEKNQRIATFMVYGKGVLWHNLLGDMKSLENKAEHAACPVIKGDKWVTTFWIRQHGHEFTFPCSLTPPKKNSNTTNVPKTE